MTLKTELNRVNAAIAEMLDNHAKLQADIEAFDTWFNQRCAEIAKQSGLPAPKTPLELGSEVKAPIPDGNHIAEKDLPQVIAAFSRGELPSQLLSRPGPPSDGKDVLTL